jgi:hypothetical protein
VPAACLRARMTEGYGRLAHLAEDNDVTRAEQRDVPGGEQAQRSWTSVLANDANQVVVKAVGTVAGVAVTAGAQKVISKIRKPPDPPPPSASDGGA